MEILEKIFGSAGKVKMMRLFLFNPHSTFDVGDISERGQISAREVRREIAVLSKIGFVKKRTYPKDTNRTSKSGTPIKRKVSGWTLDEKFPYISELHSLLINTAPVKNGSFVKKIQRVGRIKLIIVAGIFIQNPDSRVDLLVVGDNLKKGALQNVIKYIESEVGKELRYAAFETGDFKYRISVYDKLVRDILDFPHIVIVDKLKAA